VLLVVITLLQFLQMKGYRQPVLDLVLGRSCSALQIWHLTRAKHLFFSYYLPIFFIFLPMSFYEQKCPRLKLEYYQLSQLPN
jgi:hypothetical protein